MSGLIHTGLPDLFVRLRRTKFYPSYNELFPLQFRHMSGFDIVAMAASAGGLNALTLVLGALPREFPVGILVVQHLDPRHRTEVLSLFRARAMWSMPATGSSARSSTPAPTPCTSAATLRQ